MSTQTSGPHKRQTLLTTWKAIRGLLATAMLGACGGTPEVDLDFGEATETTEAGGSVEVIEPDLEAVFLHLTGKALRD